MSKNQIRTGSYADAFQALSMGSSVFVEGVRCQINFGLITKIHGYSNFVKFTHENIFTIKDSERFFLESQHKSIVSITVFGLTCYQEKNSVINYWVDEFGNVFSCAQYRPSGNRDLNNLVESIDYFLNPRWIGRIKFTGDHDAAYLIVEIDKDGEVIYKDGVK